jgi:DNA-binding CsgD family transcriptional regulator
VTQYSGRGLHPDHEETEIQLVLPVGPVRDSVLELLKYQCLNEEDLPTYTFGPVAQKTEDYVTPWVMQGPPQRNRSLTPTEQYVVGLAIQGKTNATIAAEMFITVSTVEQHFTKIYRRLGMRFENTRRQKLIAWAAYKALDGCRCLNPDPTHQEPEHKPL